MIQAALFNTSPLNEIAKLVGCEYVHKEQNATVEASNNNTLVVFIGGITYLEVTAMRLLKKLDPSVNLVILTTNIIKGDMVINEVCNRCKLKESTNEKQMEGNDLPAGAN